MDMQMVPKQLFEGHEYRQALPRLHADSSRGTPPTGRPQLPEQSAERP